MRPAELIDPYLRRLEPERLARHVYDRCRGYDRRAKVKDLCAALFGEVPAHGSAGDVAMRERLAELVKDGLPIASEPGAEGGIWWLETEQERMAAMGPLIQQQRALSHRIDSLRTASLAYRPPRGQQSLL